MQGCVEGGMLAVHFVFHIVKASSAVRMIVTQTNDQKTIKSPCVSGPDPTLDIETKMGTIKRTSC